MNFVVALPTTSKGDDAVAALTDKSSKQVRSMPGKTRLYTLTAGWLCAEHGRVPRLEAYGSPGRDMISLDPCDCKSDLPQISKLLWRPVDLDSVTVSWTLNRFAWLLAFHQKIVLEYQFIPTNQPLTRGSGRKGHVTAQDDKYIPSIRARGGEYSEIDGVSTRRYVLVLRGSRNCLELGMSILHSSHRIDIVMFKVYTHW